MTRGYRGRGEAKRLTRGVTEREAWNRSGSRGASVAGRRRRPRSTRPPGASAPACASLGWARDGAGRGLFYEESGTDPETVRGEIRAGLDHGMGLREWTPAADPEVVVESMPASEDAYTTAVVVAACGESEPLV